jgi:(S)-3,5-dihydroxyphenylglycine transaminase
MVSPLPLADLHACLSDPLLDTMTQLNEITTQYPGAISFAPGRPHEGFFETESIHTYLDAYLDHLAKDRGLSPDEVRTAMFQYGRTKGIIHELVARTLANDEDLHVSPDALVVTVGAQEGMLLTLRALTATAADVLLVSSPCYVGITGAARLLDIEVVLVPEGPAGPDPEALAEAAAALRARGRRPRAFYVVPDFANPSGRSMTIDARKELLRTAEEADLLIIEDNPYGFFTHAPHAPHASRTGAGPAPDGGPPPDPPSRPTLKALDRDARVIHLGSFAKTCFPGARLGYVVADQQVTGPGGRRGLLADELAKLKSRTTVNTPSLSQAVIGGMLIHHDFRLREANAESIRFYAAGMRTLLAALGDSFPPEERARLGIGWNVPEGGFFLVVDVPFTADEPALERCARDYGVLWTPMSGFYPGGGGERTLRLSCSYVAPELITEGVRRLAAFIRDAAR